MSTTDAPDWPFDPVAYAAEAGPEAAIAAVLARAERRETPCGDGAMVWHCWRPPAGTLERPPVALLHGGFGSWTHWIRVIPMLAQRRTLLVADIPGKGDSADAPKPHTADLLAAVMGAGLDALVPAPAVFDLVGFSFGGTVGSRVAMQAGERCRTYVAVGASGFGGLHHLVDGIRVPDPDLPDDEVEAIHRENLRILMLADPANIDALALHTHRLNVARSRVRSRAISKTTALVDALPGIQARIAGIWGALDATGGGPEMLAERAAIFRRHQPDAPFEIVEGAGHWVMYEAPEALVAALEAVLGD